MKFTIPIHITHAHYFYELWAHRDLAAIAQRLFATTVLATFSDP